jgi:hypothetical protein
VCTTAVDKLLPTDVLLVSDQMKCSKKVVVVGFVSTVCFVGWHLLSFEDSTRTEDTLRDILDCEYPENSIGNNIFFVESFGFNKSAAINPASLTSRAACAVESAAIKNPELKVFVVVVGKSRLEDSKQIRALKSFGNIHFVRLDLVPFSKTTPMGDWIEGGKLFISKFIKNNISNALRILLLWK